MFQFPTVDPIPLPAPVWLFKLLHIVTLTLHLTAVQLILGGVTVAGIWNFFGREGSSLKEASNSILKKLPTVMTYVINFGVPPLLFAQVLYGRALYTSSVLIGLYWIGVIVVLTLIYFLLYRSVDRANEGKAWWGYGIVIFAGLMYIAKVFSINMTLMLRPEDWQAIYAAGGGLGTSLPTGDPTTTPRFLFMLAGGIGLSGAAMTVISGFGDEKDTTKDVLRRWGGILAALFIALQGGAGLWVYNSQVAAVKAGLFQDPMFAYAIYAWAGLLILSVVAAAAAAFGPASRARLTSTATVLFGVLATGAFTLLRDRIRDVTLLSKGFDVWDRTVVANWSVVLLFLGLFVAALILIGYILFAIARSARQMALGATVPGQEQMMNEVLERHDDQ